MFSIPSQRISPRQGELSSRISCIHWRNPGKPEPQFCPLPSSFSSSNKISSRRSMSKSSLRLRFFLLPAPVFMFMLVRSLMLLLLLLLLLLLFVLMMLMMFITVLIVMLANAKKLNGEKEELDGQTERPSKMSSIGFSRFNTRRWKGESDWQDWQVWLGWEGGHRWISALLARHHSFALNSWIFLIPYWHCCCCYYCHCCCCYCYCCCCSGCCCWLWLSLSQKWRSRMWASWNSQRFIICFLLFIALLKLKPEYVENVIAALFLVAVPPLNINIGGVSRFSEYPS